MSNTVNRVFRMCSTTQRVFEDNTSQVIFMRSGIGTGKSSSAIFKACDFCLQHCPPSEDGEPSRARILVVRQDQSKLRSTFLATLKMWFGEVSDDLTKMQYPIVITDMPYSDEVNGVERTVLIEWVLIGVATLDEAETKLRSFEATAAIIEEAQTYDNLWIVNAVDDRLGRYPLPKRGDNGDILPNQYRGQKQILVPFNPPPNDHWLFQLEKGDKKTNGWKFYTYPAPILVTYDADGKMVDFAPNPEADYAKNQPSGYKYWLEKAFKYAEQKNYAKIKVDVLGDYGSSYSGKPVFSDWEDDKHILQNKTIPAKGKATYIGFDHSGVHPAAVISQVTESGRLILGELVVGEMIVEEFIEDVLETYIALMGIDKQDCWIILDPSDPRGKNKNATTRQLLVKRGFKPSQVFHISHKHQSPQIRQDTVTSYLQRYMIKVSPECKTLIEAMRGKYAREKVRGTDIYKAIPDAEKLHPWSDVVDALQYLCVYWRYGRGFERDANTNREIGSTYNGGRLV